MTVASLFRLVKRGGGAKKFWYLVFLLSFPLFACHWCPTILRRSFGGCLALYSRRNFGFALVRSENSGCSTSQSWEYGKCSTSPMCSQASYIQEVKPLESTTVQNVNEIPPQQKKIPEQNEINIDYAAIRFGFVKWLKLFSHIMGYTL